MIFPNQMVGSQKEKMLWGICFYSLLITFLKILLNNKRSQGKKDTNKNLQSLKTFCGISSLTSSYCCCLLLFVGIEYTKQFLMRHSDKSSQIMSPSISASMILDVFSLSRSASRGESEFKRKSFKQETIHSLDYYQVP